MPTELFPDFEAGPHTDAPLADTDARQMVKRWKGEAEKWMAYERGVVVKAIKSSNGFYVNIGSAGRDTYLAPEDFFVKALDAIEYGRQIVRGEVRQPACQNLELRPDNTFGSRMSDEQYADWRADRSALEHHKIAAE